MRKIFVLIAVIITAVYLAYIAQTSSPDNEGTPSLTLSAVPVEETAPPERVPVQEQDREIAEQTPSFISFKSEHILDIDPVLQMPDYPTGCEIVSLTMALRYFTGLQVSVDTLIDDYLSTTDNNFIIGFMGNPRSADGGGCYPPVIVNCANRYFADNHMQLTASDASGITTSELYRTIDAGFPVLMWTTMYLGEPTFIGPVQHYNGKTYEWYISEHCILVKGYIPEENLLVVNDPLIGETEYDVETFMKISDTIGNLAVIIQ